MSQFLMVSSPQRSSSMKHPRTVMSLLTNCRTKPASYLTFPLGGSQKDHMPQTGSAQGFRLLFSHYVLLFCNPMDSSPPGLCPWGFPGKNTGGGCHVLLQEIFQAWGSNMHLLQWQAGSLPSEPPGKPQLWDALGFLWIHCHAGHCKAASYLSPGVRG